jgi:hypothetical protein
MHFFHPEVKRVERLQLYDAMSQAVADSGKGQIPYVAHKKNHCEWLVVLRAKDFFKLVREYVISYGDD